MGRDVSKSPHDRGESSSSSDRPPRAGPTPPPPLKRSGWVWETDAAGRYTWCSPEIEKHLGYGQKEAVGKPVASFSLEPEFVPALSAALNAFQPIRNLRVRGHAKSGQKLDLIVNALPRTDPSGARLGYRGVTQVLGARSVTPAPAAAEAEIIPASDGVGFVDSEGALRAYSVAAGLPPARMIHTRDQLFVPLRIQDRPLGFLEMEKKQDGLPFDQDDIALVEGVLQQLALAIQDARVMQLTRSALEEMREADRLKSQFLANMSHELRTPLNSIIGFSRVILKGIDGPTTDTQQQDLTAIHNAGLHLLGLINDILDLSKIEAGKMELAFSDMDLREIIRGVMSTAVALVKDKPIELVVDYPEDLPIIQADSIRVRQILLNLVSNAAKFTERGKIGVSAQLDTWEGTPEIRVCVMDTGPGIEPKDQAKLFEPFSQVDASPTRKTGGTGLGLSICRHLVDLHGGRIWLESVPGQGSKFFFTLPVQASGQPQLAPPAPGRSVVLLTSHANLHEDLRRALEAEEVSVTLADASEKALLSASASTPLAIIVDPSKEGESAWRAIYVLKQAEATKKIPLIVAGVSSTDRQARCLPVVDVLIKPLSPSSLLPTLKRLATTESERLNLLVVDDRPEDRAALRDIVERQAQHRVQEAASIADALNLTRQTLPNGLYINPLIQDGAGLPFIKALARDERLKRSPMFALLPPSYQAFEEQGARRMMEDYLRSSSLGEEDLATFVRRMLPAVAR
jgi:signal transduction histidine kinase/CheY-like chemotaxis protein